MNDNDKALAGLAWAAATIPTLIAQDCLKGDEIVAISAGPYDVTVQIDDFTTAERIAARLDLPERDGFDVKGKQTWWIGHDAGIEIRVCTLDPSPSRRECMDEVTA